MAWRFLNSRALTRKCRNRGPLGATELQSHRLAAKSRILLLRVSHCLFGESRVSWLIFTIAARCHPPTKAGTGRRLLTVLTQVRAPRSPLFEEVETETQLGFLLHRLLRRPTFAAQRNTPNLQASVLVRLVPRLRVNGWKTAQSLRIRDPATPPAPQVAICVDVTRPWRPSEAWQALREIAPRNVARICQII